MIKLGGQEFSSWNKARTYFNSIIKKYKAASIEAGPPYRISITPDQKKYWSFVKAMFNMLSSKRSKLKGEKLQRFEVAPEHGDAFNATGNWCMFVVNSVGNKEKWSARTIGKAKKKVQSDLHKSVFRLEISAQADNWAKQYPYIVQCELCETEILNPKTNDTQMVIAGTKRLRKSNVDHDVHKGQAFVTSYLQFKKKLRGQNIDIKWSNKYGRKVPRLKDRKLAGQWQRFHKQKTVFRFLCTTCNQQSENKAKRVKK